MCCFLHLVQVHFQPANIIVLEQLAILRPTASSTKTIFIAMKRVVMHLADILPTNLPVQQFQIAVSFHFMWVAPFFQFLINYLFITVNIILDFISSQNRYRHALTTQVKICVHTTIFSL